MSLIFILALTEAVWILVVAGWVLLDKRPPVATLAWIFGLALLPIVGALVYFLWGPRRFDRKKLKLRRARGAVNVAARSRSRLFEKEHPGAGQLARLATSAGGLPPMTAVAVTHYTDGDPLFDAIAAAIRAARHHVHMEYYILKEDGAFLPIVELLLARAAEGVEVRIIADALGSRLSRKFMARMRAGGIRFAYFNPTVVAKLGRRIANFRTHRKITVVDGAVGFIGGTNICCDHSRHAMQERARRDTDVQLRGEAVQGLQHTFLEDWLFASGEELSDAQLAKYFPPSEPGEQLVQIVPSGPDTEACANYEFLLAAIGMARQRVWLATPYFVPDESLLNALTIAARRGIDVELIVPRASDWRLVDAAGASNHDALLRAGAHIYLHGPPLLHAKTAVIDDDIAIVGTANLDERSFKLNFEVVAVFYGGPAVEAGAAIFRGNRDRSVRKQNLEAHAKLGRRLHQAFARLLAPQL